MDGYMKEKEDRAIMFFVLNLSNSVCACLFKSEKGMWGIQESQRYVKYGNEILEKETFKKIWKLKKNYQKYTKPK